MIFKTFPIIELSFVGSLGSVCAKKGRGGEMPCLVHVLRGGVRSNLIPEHQPRLKVTSMIDNKTSSTKSE